MLVHLLPRKLQDGVLTEQQMAEAGIGLIIAGNDTSGLGVSALMSILPLFPEVMEKLRQEQQEVRVSRVRTADCC